MEVRKARNRNWKRKVPWTPSNLILTSIQATKTKATSPKFNIRHNRGMIGTDMVITREYYSLVTVNPYVTSMSSLEVFHGFCCPRKDEAILFPRIYLFRSELLFKLQVFSPDPDSKLGFFCCYFLFFLGGCRISFFLTSPKNQNHWTLQWRALNL